MKNLICPTIRFEKFDGKWKIKTLTEIVDFFNHERIPIDSAKRKAGEYPYYGATGIIDYVESYIFDGDYVLLAEDGANIITRNSPISYLAKGKFWLNNHAHIMRMKTGSNEFLVQLLEKQDYEKFNTGTAQPKLNNDVVKKIKLQIPSDKEQSSIGSLFRTLDDLLASYKDNLANYQSLKATMLSKIFPKAGQTVPEIRLDGFEGEWDEWKLSDISQKVTEKNKDNIYTETFTNSAEFGIINQRDFFDKDISNEKSLNTYYVVRNNDYVYNPRISNFAPVGPIKRNKLGRTGVMSPLYFVFRVTNSNIDLDFLETFFNTNTWHKFMKLNGDSGARADRFAIKDSVFLNMPISIPSFSEQQSIGSYFSNLDQLITSYQEKITQLETLKKKLLQDMFI